MGDVLVSDGQVTQEVSDLVSGRDVWVTTLVMRSATFMEIRDAGDSWHPATVTHLDFSREQWDALTGLVRPAD